MRALSDGKCHSELRDSSSKLDRSKRPDLLSEFGLPGGSAGSFQLRGVKISRKNLMSDRDELILKLKTPEDCEQFAINVEKRGKSDLARAARRRAVELRALKHHAKTDAEREALEAVYAYENALSQGAGKRIRATRTWQMIERHGILAAVERVVSRPTETKGYTTLVEMGMEDKAFEAVVLRHPEAFSPEAVERSRMRLAELTALK